MLTEPQVIADIFHNTRGLTRWYLKKLSDDQMFIRPMRDGHTFNSAFWIQAHLIWAQKFLLLQGTGGDSPSIPWLDNFRLGADGSKMPDNAPSLEELRNTFSEVHELALQHVRQLDPESLGESSGLPMFETRRSVLYHAIRHEANHSGHLGWLCKIHGVKTV